MTELEQFDKIIKVFKNKNCSDDEIKSFIVNNYEYIRDNIDHIIENIFFLFNGENLYATIIVDNDGYLWSNLEDNGFTKLNDSRDDNNLGDFIIEEMLRFGENGKFDNIVPEVKKGYLKNIKTLQKIKFNSNGYYFK